MAGLDLMIMDHLLEHHHETYKGLSTLDAVAMSLVIAAFVKSAQLFFHT
jgi:NADH:ubiquinone oxidoreductase subunit 5 (subunit L)/multisubunit Na+/H+ antiporter MnhA subunit